MKMMSSFKFQACKYTIILPQSIETMEGAITSKKQSNITGNESNHLKNTSSYNSNHLNTGDISSNRSYNVNHMSLKGGTNNNNKKNSSWVTRF